MSVVLHQGDCREVMKAMPGASVDSIVCDPPYELTSKRPGGRSPATEGKVMKGFMGMAWDGSGIAYSVEMWAEALRVLKPGGHMLAFSGSRTYHRMVCAIEDAGFEVRDQIMWIYGSGFPKSRNLDGEYEGWGTALKPAHEPIVVARKPLIGTVASNVLAHGTGALNIDGCRIEAEPMRANTGKGALPRRYEGDEREASTPGQPHDLGRWPANVIHDGSAEVLAAFPLAAGQLAAGQLADAKVDPEGRKTGNVYGAMKRGNEPSADSDNGGIVGFKMKPGARRLDEGSAARFFYCAKASKEDRNEGLYSFEARRQDETRTAGSPGGDNPRNRGLQQRQNFHPTVKPTDLMAYLCRLVTPPGGTVLDPFMGSGSTGKAAVLEGFNFIGIDLSPEYLEIARARIEHAQRQGHQPSLDLEAA